MHLQYPLVLSAVLAGLGLYGIVARRNAVLVLVGVELVLAAGMLLVITAGAGPASPVDAAVLTLFVITIAAAEVVVALAVILLLFRRRGDIDLARPFDAARLEAPEASAPAPTPDHAGGATTSGGRA